MINVAIVEDKDETLSYLKALLGGSKGITVTGGYATGSDALAGIPASAPDVVIVDIGLPDISGIDVIRRLRESCSGLDMIAYTMHEDRKHLLAALKAGATGYLLKGASALEIIRAVEEVVRGGAPMSPKIARYVIEEYQVKELRKNDGALSPREKEVLEGIAKGLPEKGLAETLSLSPHTVHTHIKSIYKKLHVNSQIQAVREAKKKGIL